jgi:ribosomal protein S18 acetylase RimI-like enzyme
MVNLMVNPAHARRGYGRALCEDMLRWAAGEGFRAVVFNAVAGTNTAAIRLYESLRLRVHRHRAEGFRHPTQGFVGLHMMHRRL